MFLKFLIILVVVCIALIVTLVFAWPEHFSEKLLPFIMVGGFVLYVFLIWYLGFFVGSHKPSVPLIIICAVLLTISFLSGYYMGGK
jgi:hypothetical protein